MSTLLVRNAEVLVTMDTDRREIRGGGLFARDGVIEAVGPTEALPATADEVIDASGQVVVPGLINTHHHLNQTLTRNLPAAQEKNLFPWLQAHYRRWARTTPEASRNSTLVGLAELMLSGATTVFDHTYMFQSGATLDVQIEAARDIGVRFHASRGSMSVGESAGGLPPDDCVEDEDHILADSDRVIAAYHDPAPGAMTRIVLSPCSPFSVSEGLLVQSVELARARGVMVHTHLCETLDEERYTLEKFGRRPVAWMEDLGWSGPDVWYAHAVHVDIHEVARMASTGTGVAHCPSSNMRLASGIAPVREYLDHGVRVGLAVDGSASNDGNHMLGEVRQAMLLARLRMGLLPPEGPRTLLPSSHPLRAAEWMTARQALEMGTLGGASVLGRTDIGHLSVGARADLFTVDITGVEFAGGLSDPVAALVFCAPARAATTIVEGRVVVRDGRLVTLDLAPVIAAHNAFSLDLAR